MVENVIIEHCRGAACEVLTYKSQPTKCLVRRPGIEPGSQEWESCMIPLHQRRLLCGIFSTVIIVLQGFS